VELLVFYPANANPRNRRFDGPDALAVQQAVGVDAEVVPGFNSIALHGVVRQCVAYSDERAKQCGQPVNVWATALWHMALRRAGYERGLRRANGEMADWLAGNVAVVLSKYQARRPGAYHTSLELARHYEACAGSTEPIQAPVLIAASLPAIGVTSSILELILRGGRGSFAPS